jgi:hypothetical protein
MKLTKGKIAKLYNKKRQSLKKKGKSKRGSGKGRTFRQNRKVNLARRTMKRLSYLGGADPLPGDVPPIVVPVPPIVVPVPPIVVPGLQVGDKAAQLGNVALKVGDDALKVGDDALKVGDDVLDVAPQTPQVIAAKAALEGVSAEAQALTNDVSDDETRVLAKDDLEAVTPEDQDAKNLVVDNPQLGEEASAPELPEEVVTAPELPDEVVTAPDMSNEVVAQVVTETPPIEAQNVQLDETQPSKDNSELHKAIDVILNTVAIRASELKGHGTSAEAFENAIDSLTKSD